MKAVTLKQWEKMPDRSKSWLLVKALGLWTDVWWHVSLDGSYAKIASGGYRTEEHARAVLKYKPNNFPKTARVRRDFSFLELVDPKGDNLNPAHTLIAEMLKRGWRCRLEWEPLHMQPGWRCAQFYKGAGDDCESFFFDSTNITDAIAAAALQALGLMERYPF